MMHPAIGLTEKKLAKKCKNYWIKSSREPMRDALICKFYKSIFPLNMKTVLLPLK